MSDRTKCLLTFLGLALALLIFGGTAENWALLGVLTLDLAWRTALGIVVIALIIGLWNYVRSRR